jgi:hypothetical protein
MMKVPPSIQVPRQLGIASGFLIAGIVACCGLAFALNIGNALSGVGDGASHGGNISIEWALIFFGGYFGSGCLSSLIRTKVTRAYLAILAHILPYLTLGLMRGKDIIYTMIFIFFLQVFFIPMWLCLFEDNESDNQTT